MTGGQTITVVQGEYAVSDDPAVMMSTVLGSCVSVCLYDQDRRIGGMNHFLLAIDKGGQSTDLRYGVNAMELLINDLLKSGAERWRLRAKLFGGARMTQHLADIGGSNATFAQDFLDREGITCVSKSLGGVKARRVQFIPATGAVRQMQISTPLPEVLAPQPTPPTQAEITLF